MKVCILGLLMGTVSLWSMDSEALRAKQFAEIAHVLNRVDAVAGNLALLSSDLSEICERTAPLADRAFLQAFIDDVPLDAGTCAKQLQTLARFYRDASAHYQGMSSRLTFSIQ